VNELRKMRMPLPVSPFSGLCDHCFICFNVVVWLMATWTLMMVKWSTGTTDLYLCCWM